MIQPLNWGIALRWCRFAMLMGLLQGLSANEVIVRTQLSPETVWVGQRMQLQIDVLGKNGWAQITDLSEIEVPGSYVRPSGNSRVRLNETIQGASYTGQRYELSIYPQRSGAQQLPSIDLLIKIQTWGPQSSAEPIEVATDAIPFSATLPEAADSTLPLIVSTDFSANQTWEPDQSDFKVGDALKRRVTLTVKDLPAMVLPPLSDNRVAGVSTYSETPKLSDSEEAATRIETVTHVFEQDAQVELPNHQFQWWNPDTKTLEIITLEGRSIVITGGVETPLTEQKPRNFTFTVGLLAVAVIPLAWFLFRHFILSKSSSESNEAGLFRQVLAASKQNDPTETLNRMMAWLNYIGERPSHFFATYSDTNTQGIADRLLREPRSVRQLTGFDLGLKQARKRFRAESRKSLSKADAALPPLNR